MQKAGFSDLPVQLKSPMFGKVIKNIYKNNGTFLGNSTHIFIASKWIYGILSIDYPQLQSIQNLKYEILLYKMVKLILKILCHIRISLILKRVTKGISWWVKINLNVQSLLKYHDLRQITNRFWLIIDLFSKDNQFLEPWLEIFSLRSL